MTKEFKVGDKVTCILDGKGIVSKIIIEDKFYPIKVNFENGRNGIYTDIGKYFLKNIHTLPLYSIFAVLLNFCRQFVEFMLPCRAWYGPFLPVSITPRLHVGSLNIAWTLRDDSGKIPGTTKDAAKTANIE